MRQKVFLQTAAAIFTVVGVLHILRILNGWELQIGGFTAPMWASWVAMPIAIFLAYTGMKYANKK